MAAVRRWGPLTGKIALGVVSLLVLGLCGAVWGGYTSLNNGLNRSDALSGEAKSLNGDTNILIMGLDSRLDENGNPLPADIYNQLHAGDSNDGGENANVLMLLHVPADGSKATSISIPRDDYVDIPNCPDGQCKGKIKQAYGLAFDAESKQLTNQSGLSATQKVQQEREAARKEEIDTVRQLTGGVPVDHFVEVTLVSFYEIANVVQPITVCVNEDTQDSYSGANFHQGQNQLTAAQAVAFVRQRRDYVHPALNFTDLDRERRQQAFIASLAYQLKQAGTLTSPSKLQGILDVAKQNIAVDKNLDLLQFAQEASSLTSGNVSFVTLPIKNFGKDSSGEDVNIIDVPTIQALVHQLIGGGSSSGSSQSSGNSAPSGNGGSGSAGGGSGAASGTVDVVNSTTRNGLAAELLRALVAKGYTQGEASSDSTRHSTSVLYYGSGEQSAATSLSNLLGGMETQPDSNVAAGHLKVVIGSDFTMPSGLSSGGVGTGTGTSGTPAGSGSTPTGSGSAPDTSDAGLSAISGGGIPCVK